MGYKRIQFHSGLQPEHSPAQYLYNKHNYIKKKQSPNYFSGYILYRQKGEIQIHQRLKLYRSETVL